MPFTFTELSVPGIVLVESRSFGDDRGSFAEAFKSSEFSAAGLPAQFVQDNMSRSSPGVLRGLHYQRDPHAQGKLVSVVAGAIWDVGVDIREGSPTYGKWAGVELTASDHRALYIPPGYLHGFVVLGDVQAIVSYKCTNEYNAEADGGVQWNDPSIAIDWPIDFEPLLSPKDATQPSLADARHGFVYPGLSGLSR